MMSQTQIIAKLIQACYFCIFFLIPSYSFAYSTGITGYSGHPSDETCAYCHYNGAGAAGEGCSSAAAFNYTGSITTSTSVSRGATQSVDFSMTRMSGTLISLGGMGARVDGGTFSDTGGGTVSVSTTTATHNGSSNTPTAGNIAWNWNWTAPTTPGDYDLYVCGNPTNGGFTCSDDGPHTNTCKSTTITVNNALPSASDDGTLGGSQFLTVSQDASSTNTGNVLSNDSDADTASGGDVISVDSFSTSPGGFTTSGLVSNNGNGTFAYNPNGQYDYLKFNEYAVDRFQYTVADDQSATDTAIVYIRVTGVNDNPTITVTANDFTEDSGTLAGDEAASYVTNDVDNDTLVVSFTGGSNSNGHYVLANSRVELTSAGVATINLGNPLDSIDLTVTDNGQGNLTGSDSDTPNVFAVSDPPTFNETAVTTSILEDNSLIVDYSATDVDDDDNAIEWSVSSDPSHGTVTVIGGVLGVATASSASFNYTPTANYFTGTDSPDTFIVKAESGGLEIFITTTITINSVNDAIELASISDETINEGELLTVTAIASDADSDDVNDGGGSIVWSISSGQESGMAISATGVFTWTPPQTGTFNDVYTVTITAADSLEDGTSEASQSFSITVNPPDADSDNVADYDDFCPAIADSTNADNDGDGTAGTDTDSTDDVGGDVCDADDDNDGMPDSFELANNFDPFDAADAVLDFDGDGISNLDEFINGSNPLLATIIIDATGYLTEYVWTEPDPSTIHPDATIVIGDNYGPYRPGVHTMTWTVSNVVDSNLATSEQSLSINPIITFDADQQTGEGETVTVTASINGDAVNYPVTVNYSVAGSADGSDHDAVAGSLSIADGDTSDSVMVNIFADSVVENNETIVFTLDSASNAVIGTQAEHSITISDENLMPQITLNIEQNGQAVVNAFDSEGTVTVTANISDANSSQSHTLDWSETDSGLSAPSDDSTLSWTFTPVEGIYDIALEVTDNGSPNLTNTLVKTLVVSSAAPPVLGGDDTDEDGNPDSTEGYGDSDGDGIADYLDAIELTHLQVDQTNDLDTSYVLQAETGLKLVVGNTASAASVQGIALTDTEIKNFGGSSGSSVSNSEDSFEHIGGIYDFTVSGLVPGASTYIVIPLQVAIPRDAVYRKYNATDGWSNFVSDGVKNQVYSAPGSAGVCPEIKSSDYVKGLNYLYNCIQLLIEDGGPNDQDGLVNGRIEDPGSLSVSVSEVESEEVEKGGSLDIIALAMLMLLLVWAYKGVVIRLIKD